MVVKRHLKTKETLSYLLVVLISLNNLCNAECPPELENLSKIPWEVKTSDNNLITTYNISLCNKLNQPGCEDASVCQTNSTGGAIPIGNFSTSLNIKRNSSNGEMVLQMSGSQCPSDPAQFTKTEIIFKCGKSWGSPDFLDSHACVTYFEWYTSDACSIKDTTKEVPCYVYDKDGKKRDLSPLIKKSGGYLVADPSSEKNIFINVCRDIVHDTSTPNCDGSASCEVTLSGSRNIGSVQGGLTQDADRNLVLRYTSDSLIGGCQKKPTTNITFVCPQRGGGQDPLLLYSYLNCDYQIEWHTEYACAVDFLTSTSCQLTKDIHGVDFDLTPLRHKGLNNYVKSGRNQDNEQYKYVLNVCGGLNEMPCNGSSTEFSTDIASCQLKEGQADFTRSIGSLKHQILRYSDGELSMTYRGGSPCHSYFQRETVINFHCNRTAGAGEPVFSTESDCTYIFDWDTQYACLDHPQCRVDVGKLRFDLSALAKKEGDNWEVLNGHHVHEATEDALYYMNVCHDVLLDGKTAHCPVGAAVCSIDHDHHLSLGAYTDKPTYDNKAKTLVLHYTEGSVCDGKKKIESIITFVCRPGDLEGGPTLIRKSLDGCIYEFEWHTAAACVLGRKAGTNCRVFDDDAGFSFDLSRLTKTGDNAFYRVNTTEYDYYINVCAEVKGTECDSTPHNGAGVCQVKHDRSFIFNTGKPNSMLSYYDGMINLTYTDGEKYNGGPNRKTEIAFLCDINANDTLPEFKIEEHGTYFFKWYTQYACPEAPVECVVTDKDHKQYDLSSLSMSEDQENWSFIDDKTEPGKKRKFYLNVCRPVNPVHVGTGCDAFAAACMTTFDSNKEHISLTNLGHATAPPQIVPDGLILEYGSGQQCVNNDQESSTYTTTIHLKCTPGDLSSGPRFIDQVNNCQFTFLWETEAACAVDSAKGTEQCTVKDPNSEYTFNLQPLMKQDGEDYSVVPGRDSGVTFNINICGPVARECGEMGNKSAACLITSGSRTSIGQVQTTLDFSDDGQLTLTYGGRRTEQEHLETVVITFLCRKDIQLGEPTFVRKDDSANTPSYYFNFETALACRPEPVDCLINDNKGNQYDLTPLARVDENWLVIDSRPDHKDLQYFINVCRPLNHVKIGCPGGSIGGCQLDSHNKSFSMGYVQGKPQAASDGSLSIRYLNGEICHKGTPHESHRSTRINFFCSSSEHDPSFVGESADCEYIFTWRTPSACPLQRKIGKDCKVTDPLYNYEFDLTPLKKEQGSYQVTAGKYTFLLDVCKNIDNGKESCTNSGLCQTWEDGTTEKYVNAGKANDKILYEDGSLALNYSDGQPCHNGQFNRTTLITFTCDQAKYGNEGPKYLSEGSDCSYLFEWPTSKACPPFKIGECSARDVNGDEYDLSSLTLTNDSYIITSAGNPGKKFVLNVCSTIVHSSGTTCPLNSAACLVNTDEADPKKKYKSLGMIPENPVTIENKHLLLTYVNGDTCSNGNKSKTTIVLKCDEESIDSRPTYSYSENNCDYYFTWFTKAACSISSTVPERPSTNCKATNPETGYEFDLSSLKSNSGYQLNDDKGGHSYKINVCKAVEDNGCSSDNNGCTSASGSCQKDTNVQKCFNAGDSNSNLVYNDGVLYLNYSGGSVCQHNNKPRNTIISFVCGAEGTGNGSPVFVDESDDCSYYISWHTELACETQVSCAVKGNDSLDLSPLIKTNGYHVAVNVADSEPDEAFYINICRPLNPIPHHLCPPGASACRVKTTQHPVSLGHVNQPPFVDKDSGKVTLLYDHGSTCEKKPSVNTTTRIVFICQPGPDQGSPELEEVTDDCQYIFLWKSNVVCRESSKPEISPDCKFYDQRTKHTYDFSSLKQQASNLDDGYRVPGAGYGVYYINICAAIIDSTDDSCKNAGVCHMNDNNQGTSFGEAYHPGFFMEEGHVRMKYKNGDSCAGSGSGKASSQIIFECDRTATHDSKPELLSRSSCDVVFHWRTSLACPPAIEDCIFQDNGNTYDLRLLSQVTGSWKLKDNKQNSFWLNICQGVHRGPNDANCPSYAAACRQLTDGTVDMLGQVETQQMKMSVDGKSIVLTYTEGGDACAHGKRRSDNKMATTVIKLECGNTVGGPLFIPSEANENDCIFEFHWKSSIACKDERVPVTEINGVIVDPKSQVKINLNTLGKETHSIDEIRGKDQYQYLISLGGNVDVDANGKSKCGGSAICQIKKKNAQFYRSLGQANQRTFYVEDDVLEAVFVSSDTCGHIANKKVKTIIDFHCGETREPTFLYESHGCEYLFDWYTSVLCEIPKVVVPKPVAGDGHDTAKPGTSDVANSGTAGQNMKAGTVVAIVSVFAGVIIICLLLIIFHKQERRSAFKLKMKSLFRLNSANQHRYEYSKLLNEDEDVLLNNMADSTESTSLARSVVTRSYHDDSDEDMLL